jgi:hypothetical protein
LNYNSKTDSRIERDAVVSRAREMSDLKVTMKGADIVVGIEIYRVSDFRLGCYGSQVLIASMLRVSLRLEP